MADILQDLNVPTAPHQLISLSLTAEEVSLSVPTSFRVAPQHTSVEGGWKLIKVEGCIDFGVIGLLADLSTVLAQESISVFVVSTFDTDWIMVKKEHFTRAQEVLSQDGWSVIME